MVGQTPERSAELQSAIDAIVACYGDIHAIARATTVSATEVAQELATVEYDSSDGVALRLLAQYNPT